MKLSPLGKKLKKYMTTGTPKSTEAYMSVTDFSQYLFVLIVLFLEQGWVFTEKKKNAKTLERVPIRPAPSFLCHKCLT